MISLPAPLRWLEHHTTGRAISIVLALASAIGLWWLLYVRAKWNPPAGEAEFFWLRVYGLFVLNAIFQQLTLSTETGRGSEVFASLDKFIALAPLAAFGGAELFWFGKESIHALSWRHHFVGLSWAVYSVIDYFSTDITNQRLRALQLAPQRQS